MRQATVFLVSLKFVTFGERKKEKAPKNGGGQDRFGWTKSCIVERLLMLLTNGTYDGMLLWVISRDRKS